MVLNHNHSMRSHSLFLLENIESIVNQSFNNWELLIFSNETEYIKNLIFKILNKNYEIYKSRFKFIKTNLNTSFKDILLISCELCNGKYLCPINYLDVIHKERIANQVKLIDEKNLNIVSSLELPYLIKEKILIEYNKDKFNLTNFPLYFACNDFNKFISAEDIDFACLSSYIPLDLYTFMIKRSFVKKLQNILLKKQIEKDLHLILFFLSYTQIEKAKNAFTYIRFPRIPYEENKHIDNSLLSNNIISFFNKYKTIENRKFLIDSLDKYNFSEPPKKSKKALKVSHSKLLNILIPIEEINIGGTETYILSLCNALTNYNITPYILTKGGILEDTFILNDITLIKSYPEILNKSNLKVKKKGIKTSPNQEKKEHSHSYDLTKLKNIMEKYNIDILFCHGPNEIELCCELKKIYYIPVLATIHGTYYEKEIIFKAASYFEAMIFVSKMCFLKYEDTLKDFNQSKFHIIPNSIDIKKTSYITKPKFFENNKELSYLNTLLEKIDESNKLFVDIDTPKILTYCSRLSLGKCRLALLFLKSFEELLETHKNIYALILGDGKEKSKIVQYANKINSKYGTKVFVIGSLENVDYFYKKSFAVIGTGRVALESLCIGTPVFALGLSGFKGLVSNKNINEMIESNFGDHLNTPYSLKDSNADTKDLKNELNTFLFTTDYSSISKWCKNYVENHLNMDISMNKIFNILFNILNYKL